MIPSQYIFYSPIFTHYTLSMEKNMKKYLYSLSSQYEEHSKNIDQRKVYVSLYTLFLAIWTLCLTYQAKNSVISKVQFSSKATFAHVWNASEMHLKCIHDMSETSGTCTRHICASAKPLYKAAARLRNCHAFFTRCRTHPEQDAYGSHAGYIWSACRMHLGCMQMLPWSWVVPYLCSL